MADLRKTPHLLPDWWHEPWVRLLEAAYDADGPGATGRRLGVSASMVTAVARGYYTSSLDTIRQATEAVLGAREVSCPVLGALPLVDCRHHRERPFRSSNPQAVALFRACRSCPNNPNATT